MSLQLALTDTASRQGLWTHGEGPMSGQCPLRPRTVGQQFSLGITAPFTLLPFYQRIPSVGRLCYLYIHDTLDIWHGGHKHIQ